MDNEAKKKPDGELVAPKVFISYSWTSQEHQDRIRHYAEKMVTSHIQVVMDI